MSTNILYLNHYNFFFFFFFYKSSWYLCFIEPKVTKKRKLQSKKKGAKNIVLTKIYLKPKAVLAIIASRVYQFLLNKIHFVFDKWSFHFMKTLYFFFFKVNIGVKN